MTGRTAAARSLVGLLSLWIVAPGTAVGQDNVRREMVELDENGIAIVEDSITGYSVIDYVVAGRAGQYANISMATDNGANYFNIIAPGEETVAMFNGSMAENQFEGELPEAGEYRIRVYLFRSAARREEIARYRLEVIVRDPGQ